MDTTQVEKLAIEEQVRKELVEELGTAFMIPKEVGTSALTMAMEMFSIAENCLTNQMEEWVDYFLDKATRCLNG